jgi:hypothetical protein
MKLTLSSILLLLGLVASAGFLSNEDTSIVHPAEYPDDYINRHVVAEQIKAFDCFLK